MTRAHILGYPRVGAQRELKFAQEAYWRGELEAEQLKQVAEGIYSQNWQLQHDAGLDFVTVGDFSYYDHVLDTSLLLGVVPQRFRPRQPVKSADADSDFDLYFRMARGRSRVGDNNETYACEMTKWFDTNYHYLVPEFEEDQQFALSSQQLFEQVTKAQDAGFNPKPILLGPLSYLWLGKTSTEFDRLRLLERLLPVYREILNRLQAQGVAWIQIDEPALVLDLPVEWKQAYEKVYNQLSSGNLKILLATYFGDLQDNLNLAVQLPVAGLHIDVVRGPEQLSVVLDKLPPYKVLSVGVVDGRNIWRTDFKAVLRSLQAAKDRLGQRLWLGSSCSLLHSPVDLECEIQLNKEVKSWLAFAKQKVSEVQLLAAALVNGEEAIAAELAENQRAVEGRRHSEWVTDVAVRQAVAEVLPNTENRDSHYQERAVVQRETLQLPLWPTTTIGSFPQTTEIRRARLQYKKQEINFDAYKDIMQHEIGQAIKMQEQIGLDVLGAW